MPPASTKRIEVDNSVTRRWAVEHVTFRTPVEVELGGVLVSVQRLASGETPAHHSHPCSPISVDPDLRILHIGEDMYPLELVMRFRRAKAAKKSV
jgi:hypothetical protein